MITKMISVQKAITVILATMLIINVLAMIIMINVMNKVFFYSLKIKTSFL